MKKILVAIIMIFAVLNAETVKQKQPACISEELLDEFFTALYKKDNRQMFMLVAQSKCFMLEPGQKVSVVKVGFSKVTLRLYYDDGTFKVIAPIEAIQKK